MSKKDTVGHIAKTHYVSNIELLETIAADKLTGVLSNKLAKMLYMIAERYSYIHSFSGYSFREDMVSCAVVNLCSNWYKFDPERSDNPFSYMTTSVYRSFLQYISEEKKQRNIRDTLLVDAGASPSFAYQEKSKSSSSSDEIVHIAESE